MGNDQWRQGMSKRRTYTAGKIEPHSGFHSSWMFKIVLIAGKLAVVVLVVQSLLAK
jgi:hypothetical protein